MLLWNLGMFCLKSGIVPHRELSPIALSKEKKSQWSHNSLRDDTLSALFPLHQRSESCNGNLFRHFKTTNLYCSLTITNLYFIDQRGEWKIRPSTPTPGIKDRCLRWWGSIHLWANREGTDGVKLRFQDTTISCLTSVINLLWVHVCKTN